jgi:hypothetical protein
MVLLFSNFDSVPDMTDDETAGRSSILLFRCMLTTRYFLLQQPIAILYETAYSPGEPMNTARSTIHRTTTFILTTICLLAAAPRESIFEPVFRDFTFLPDYYLKFDVSTFAFHHDAFFKRQYLAEIDPSLGFRLISFRDLISSVWDVNFQFGLGEVPNNNVFTVLNVSFSIDPKIELKLRALLLSGGLTHNCYHEVDRRDFPLVYNNRLHVEAFSFNERQHDYFHAITLDSILTYAERFAWQAGVGYYLKEFFGLASPDKLNGNSPYIADLSTDVRYTFARRRSWFFTARSETTLGIMDSCTGDDFHILSGVPFFWKQALGVEAYFSRGKQGANFYVIYLMDILPGLPNSPEFTLGHSRFSKDGLFQIGIRFFN